MQYLKLLVIGIFCTLSKAQDNLCLINNGNCSHQCLYRSGNVVECGCPCGQVLSPSKKSCQYSQSTTSCNLDIYVLMDISKFADQPACVRYNLFNTIGLNNTVSFASWTSWKNSVISILEDMRSDTILNPNVGVQLYPGRTSFTVGNYIGSPNLTDAINSIQQIPMPNCSTDGYYMPSMYNAGDAGINLTTLNPPRIFEPMGPYQLRSKANTTRVAIAFADTTPITQLNEADVLGIRESVLQSFDVIFVITKTQESINNPVFLQRASLFACGNATTPCPNIFWTNLVNSFSVPLSYFALKQLIDLNACRRRSGSGNTSNVLSLVTCTNQMVFEVKLCHLRGMNASDLVFNNHSCIASDYATFSPDGLTMRITMDYNTCGMVLRFVNDTSGAQMQVFEQSLKTRNYSNSQNLLNVNLQISCKLSSALTASASVDIKPAADIIVGNKSAMGNFGLSMNVLLTDGVSTSLAGVYQAVVGCRIVIEAVSVLPADFFLHLWSCWATPSNSSNDTQRYQLAASRCPKDPTFQILPSPANNVARISFEMFEFTSGFKKIGNLKSAVYIHCEYTICKDNTSERCSNCNSTTGRRRRDAHKDEKSVIKTIGPIIIKPKDKAEDQVKTGGQISNSNSKSSKKQISSGTMESNQFYEIIMPSISNKNLHFSDFYTIFMVIVLLMIVYVMVLLNRKNQGKHDFQSHHEFKMDESLNRPPPYAFKIASTNNDSAGDNSEQSTPSKA